MKRLNDTTADSLGHARTRMGGDWDAYGTVTLHLPADVAPLLLISRGWSFNGQQWAAPSGEKFWHVDEALRLALIAETVEHGTAADEAAAAPVATPS